MRFSVPVTPGYQRCQHCYENLVLAVDQQLRTVAPPERSGFTTCPDMPRVAHRLLPKVGTNA